MNRFSQALFLAATALASLPAIASAQGDEGLVRYLSSPGNNGDGMPERDCSPEALEYYAEEEALSTSPATRVNTTLPSGLTPEEADDLRRQRQQQLRVQIAQFDELLATMAPDYPNRPMILFRKAEALKEIADADYLVAYANFTECMDNWYTCATDTECYEPYPDYEEAIAEYRAIARNHADYDRIDEVIFRLGETLMENDAAADGVSYLTRLVSTYPDSQYIPDAHVLLADYYFDAQLLLMARQNYEDVLTYADSSVYNYAVYKLGWVDINEELYDDALARFQTVVSNEDASGNLVYRNQALNDMLLSYVQLENGWQSARDYYMGLEGETFMRRKLSSLANLYDEQGKDESRVAVLDYFLSTFSMDEMVPQWAADTLDSLGKIGDWDRKEQAARDFIVMVEPTGQWALSNQGSRQLTNARMFSEAWLLDIIVRNETEARRFNDPLRKRELFEEVATDYGEYFERFGDSEAAYEQRFLYSEILYYQLANEGACGPDNDHYTQGEECMGFLRQAGEQYREVVEMRPDPNEEHTHSAAFGALQVFDIFMSADNPRVDEDLPAPGAYDQFFGERVDLNASAQDYVEIVTWFSELFPEDDQIPAASWRAASLYLYAAQIEEAAARFETIIEHHPNHQFAQNAALAAFVCYNQVENWVKIESVARRLIESCDGDDSICRVDSLSQAIAYAMNNQAEDLMEAGDRLRIDGDDRGAREQYLAAADKRVSLYREFPAMEWSPTALYNAAVTYESARQITTSVELLNEYLNVYPEHELVSEAMYLLAAVHESQAEFGLAAQWYETVADREDFEESAEALLVAAQIRRAMSEFDEAIALFGRYQDEAPDSDEAKAIYFEVADIERTRGNLDAAYARLEDYKDDHSDDALRTLLATYQQAEIRREQGEEEDALELFDEVYTLFGRGEMEFDEAGVGLGWTTAPGLNFEDEGLRIAALPYAAEARFQLAEGLFQEARNSDLSYRAGRVEELAEKLQNRGEALKNAQMALFEVSGMGDAQWAVAARTRIGQLYRDFYVDIFDLPAPDYDECLDLTDYDYDMCDMMMEQFDEIIYEIGTPLEEKAMIAWNEARNNAVAQRVYTPFTQELITEMNDTDSSYPLGGAEGVVANQVSDPYIATRYILNLDEKLAAFEQFSEFQLPEEGELIDGAAPASAE